MVRVRRSRSAVIDPLKILSRHLFALCSVALVFCCVSLYFFLLRIEERNASVGRAESKSFMVVAHSAPAILRAGKPYLVYGTAWKEQTTAALVADAARAGFRFFDTACQPKHYNEAGVGDGWTTAAREMNLKRSDFFLQTKFTPFPGQDPNRLPYNPDDSLPDQVSTSLHVSLKNLQTTYLDSMILHSPLSTLDDTLTVWRTMESFVDDGKVNQLGISNCYDTDFFSALYEQVRIKPKVLQNRYVRWLSMYRITMECIGLRNANACYHFVETAHCQRRLSPLSSGNVFYGTPLWSATHRFYKESNFDTALRVFCQEKGITYQSFWTLSANRRALASAQVKEWADRLALTPQQLMFAFLMSLGYVTPLSGTTSLQHMADDVAIMERMQAGETFFRDKEELRKFAQLLGMPML